MEYNLLKNIASSQDLLQWYCTQFLLSMLPILSNRTKEPFVAFCNGRLLSPTGRCKTFDATADGAWGFHERMPRFLASLEDGRRMWAFIGFYKIIEKIRIGSLQDGSWL